MRTIHNAATKPATTINVESVIDILLQHLRDADDDEDTIVDQLAFVAEVVASDGGHAPTFARSLYLAAQAREAKERASAADGVTTAAVIAGMATRACARVLEKCGGTT